VIGAYPIYHELEKSCQGVRTSRLTRICRALRLTPPVSGFAGCCRQDLALNPPIHDSLLSPRVRAKKPGNAQFYQAPDTLTAHSPVECEPNCPFSQRPRLPWKPNPPYQLTICHPSLKSSKGGVFCALKAPRASDTLSRLRGSEP